MIFDSVRTYKEEFGSYVSGHDDYEAYQSQECEMMSRIYGRAAREEFQKALAGRRE